MATKTIDEIIASVSSHRPNMSLGTEINTSAKMYSNSNIKEKKNTNKNTFQQSTGPLGPTNENVRGQAPRLASSPRPSASVSEGDHEGVLEKKYGRRLNWQTDKIVEIRLQIGNVRIGQRNKRASAYLSIKTESDTRYMIFMRSDLTTAIDETYRGIKRDNDKVLDTIATDMVNEFPKDNLFLGRVKYKVTKGQKIQKHHRKNLPCALLAMYIENNEFKARLHLLDTDYDFELSDDLSENQKKFYEYEGVWQLYAGTMSINDAYGE